MNPCIPDWNFEGALPAANLNKQLGPDHELVELLWRNGQVVMHSQTNRKSGTTASNEPKVVHNKHDQYSNFKSSESCWNPSSLILDDETVSWLHYPLDDPMGNEFGSNFMIESLADQVDVNKHVKQFENDKMYNKLNPFNATNGMSSVHHQPVAKHSAGPPLTTLPMAPPKFPALSVPSPCPNNLDLTRHVNLGSSIGGYGPKRTDEFANGNIREGSTMTNGLSHCSSNHIGNEVSMTSRNGVKNSSVILVKDSNNRNFVPQGPKGKSDSPDPTMDSSSGGSGSSFMISAGTNNSHKRKASNVDDSEYQSEAAELESASAKKQSQRSGSSRKTRAAEVHNLSERRRRDRINEKMKALQELIPHSNKADKASMLDEAIEYLKSLQLQLQMMWMGNGMQPMMFPSIQHYLPRMGIGMGPMMPSLHNAMQLPRVSLLDQPMQGTATPNQANVTPNPVLTPMGYQNQLPNSNLTEQYARYLAFQQMQAAPQPVNMFNFGGAQSLPSNHIIPLAATGNGPSAPGPTMDNSLGGKLTAGNG